MKNSMPAKPYWEMNTAELREATKEFDKPFIIDTFRAMTPTERKRWERIKRKPGRPRVGQGVAVVSLSIERGLLGRADKLAKKLKVSRAKLVSAGLQRVLAEAAARGTARKPKAAVNSRPTRRKAA